MCIVVKVDHGKTKTNGSGDRHRSFPGGIDHSENVSDGCLIGIPIPGLF